MLYDYYEAVKRDAIEWIKDTEYFIEGYSFDEVFDELFIADSVTGNASGSYTFSRYEASQNLVGNFDLLQEALEIFGYNTITLDQLEPENLDVIIRCYVLSNLYGELENAYNEALENEEV